MCFALIGMKRQLNSTDDIEELSKLYEAARTDWASRMMGDNNPAKRPEVRKKLRENCPARRPEVREKYRLAKLGKKRKPFTEEHLQHLREARRRRQRHSSETRARIGDSMRRAHERRKQAQAEEN